MVTTLAGVAGEAGSADGVGPEARFNRPWGIAVDRRGIVYVADRINATIRAISPAGTVHTLTGVAGEEGSVDGLGPKARLSAPMGLAINAAGPMYLTDGLTVRRLY